MRLRTGGSRIGERPSAAREGRESPPRRYLRNGAPGGIRTPDQWLRKQFLRRSDIRFQLLQIGAVWCRLYVSH